MKKYWVILSQNTYNIGVLNFGSSYRSIKSRLRVLKRTKDSNDYCVTRLSCNNNYIKESALNLQGCYSSWRGNRLAPKHIEKMYWKLLLSQRK